VALALKAREKLGQPGSPVEDLEQREMGLTTRAVIGVHTRPREQTIYNRLTGT
jgi:hypothetical protein